MMSLPSRGTDMTTEISTPADQHAASEPSRIPGIVRGLRETFATGRTREYQWRKAQLVGLERLFKENEAAIAKALNDDLGRSSAEAWIADVVGTVVEITYAPKHLKRWMRRKRVRGLPMAQQPAKAYVQSEPYGTTLIIGAWNFPFYLTIGPLVGAVAAGNTVALKPSELAPACSALMAKLLPQYLDPHAVVVVEGDGYVTQELLAQGFDKAMFTGGTEIGKRILEGAAPHLTPVALELGGKSPVYVASDANIEVAARRIGYMKGLNSGQVCLAPDYVIADASIRDELVEKIKESWAQFQADREDKGLRVLNQRQFDRLVGYLAATEGQVAVGGASDAESLTIEPTIVVDPDADEPLMQEEIFGPILPIVTAETLDAAIDFINSRPKPLAAYAFTESKYTANRYAAEVPAGGMVINHLLYHAVIPKLPFGGVGASGMGAYHGKAGFDEFSHRKSTLYKSTALDLKLPYPPYTEKNLKLMQRLM